MKNLQKILIGVAVALAVTVVAQTFTSTEGFRMSDSFSEVKAKLVQSGITITKLSKVQTEMAGATNTVNDLSVTNTFSTPFTAVPVVVLTSDTNALPHLISVTTSNFIAGVAVTNSTVRWIARLP